MENWLFFTVKPPYLPYEVTVPTGFTYQILHGLAYHPGNSTALVVYAMYIKLSQGVWNSEFPRDQFPFDVGY